MDMDQRLKEARVIADQLLSSERIDFKGLTPSRLEDGLPVVYAITDRRDGKVLYVGRTKNLRRRLYTNHLMGPATNARLKKYLTEDPERPDIKELEAAKQYLIDRCYFQYIPVADMRTRGQIEGLLFQPENPFFFLNGGSRALWEWDTAVLRD